MRRVLQLVAGVMVLWFALYLGLNDRRLGRLVSKVVTGSVRGQFHLGYAHYDYWSSLASLILSTPAHVRGGDYDLIDPDGNRVLRVESVEAELNIGELVRALLRTAVSAPFKRGVFVDLHFTSGRVRGGYGVIAPTASSLKATPERPEINIVASMSGKTVNPDPNAPGRVRILIEGDGVSLEGLSLQTRFPAWSAVAEGISGTATLRFSSAASETQPGRPAFTFAIAPLRAQRGEIVLAPPPDDLPPGEPNPYAFALRDVDLRNFGARPSRAQELTFRGSAVASAPGGALGPVGVGPGAAPVELSGRLIDVFCDPGVDLHMSFQEAGPLAAQVTAGMLYGPARGRVRLYGPFSEKPPTTPTGAPHACLSAPGYRTFYPLGSDGRAVVIEGSVADLEARAAGVHVTGARSQLKLARGVLSLPSVTGNALGGQLVLQPLRITFGKPLQWSAQARVIGTDPAQVELLTPALKRILGGRMSGTARVAGVVAPAAAGPADAEGKRRGDRIRFSGLDVSLQRRGGGDDPWPRDVSLTGEVTYTPESVSVRDVHAAGDGVRVSLPGGAVSPKSGRLALQDVTLEGGPQASRILSRLGVPAAVQSVAASLRVGGALDRPTIERGAMAVTGLDLSGRKLDELSANFTLQEGTLALRDVQLRGLGGTAYGQGSLQLFRGTLAGMHADPPLQLVATLKGISSADLLRSPHLSGALSAQLEIGGTLRRPTGTASASAPSLLVSGAPVRDVVLDLELRPEWILVNSLFAAIGQAGLLNGSAAVGREGAMPLRLTLNPRQLRLRDIPGARLLGYDLSGEVSGGVQIGGTARPLRPTLDGELALGGFGVSGRPLPSSDGALGEPPETQEPQPLFKMLGVAVRALQLGRAVLRFRPEGQATHVEGTLFDAFRVSGTVFLDPQDPRGELTLRFGCEEPPVDAQRAAAQGARPRPTSQPLDCDLPVERLLPDLRQVGDISVRMSGGIQLRFGRSLPAGPGMPIGLQAALRLQRALITVKTIDDDGAEQWYRVFNDGEVALSTDGQIHRFEQARFRSERSDRDPALPGGPPPLRGELSLAGYLGTQGSDLVLRGQVGLELVEHLLRATFRRARGTVLADLRLRGPMAHPVLVGTAELRGAQLVPHDVDTPFDILSGRLTLSPQRAELRDLQVRVDGATLRANGSLDVPSLAPLRTGALDLRLEGALAGRLLQWRFPRNLSEARGQIGLRGVRVSGALDDLRVDGQLRLAGLFLNLRRFHELQLHQGTVRLRSFNPGATAPGAPKDATGVITVGCGPERRSQGGDCQNLEASVDGDGRIWLAGEVVHGPLLGFGKEAWYEPLLHVEANIRLSNVRHSAQGVYSVEVSTADPLLLLGDKDRMTLSGKVGVVSGRYIQPFDLSERFLARRVVEEEEPFWRGDPFLSSRLELDLDIVTRGNLQVLNNIADLRLSTTDFNLSGPLGALRMGGVVRVDGGLFTIPGLRGEFTVKGDSKLEFSRQERWPDTPWVEVRGSNVQFDRNDEQKNVELALRGRVSELKIECISSDGLNAGDCASYLLLGGTAADVRRSLAGDPGSNNPRALAYGDNAAKLLSQQLLTRQLADPLREKLRLDMVRIQFGVSTFDVQLCKRFGLYLRTCGLAEWGLLASTAARYRAYGEIQLSDWAVGQVSFDRLERGFDLLQDTINRFKVQFGVRQPLRF